MSNVVHPRYHTFRQHDKILSPPSLFQEFFFITSSEIVKNCTMGRGKTLSHIVKAKIQELKRSGATNHAIAEKFQVSLQTVQRICNNLYSKPKLRGHPHVLFSSDKPKKVIRKSHFCH